MTGQWRPTLASAGLGVVAIIPTLATPIRLVPVAAAVRPAVAATLVVGSHFT